MSKETHNQNKQSLEDIDLYCLKCGYNLRGLSGDPRRCPECFHMNPVGDLEIPAAIISRQLRKMETAPTLCIAAVLFGGISLPLSIVVLLDVVTRADPATCCFHVMTLIALVVWSVCVVRFRSSCLGKSGWFGVLMRFHAFSLVLVCLVTAAAVLLHWFLEQAFPSGTQGVTDVLGLLAKSVACLLFLLGLVWILHMLHRRAKGNMEQLQREVAVTLARTTVRRALETGKRSKIVGRGGE